VTRRRRRRLGYYGSAAVWWGVSRQAKRPPSDPEECRFVVVRELQGRPRARGRGWDLEPRDAERDGDGGTTLSDGSARPPGAGS